MGRVGFYCKERWCWDSREGSPVGVLTFVGCIGFYCKERWASDSRKGSPVRVLTFVGRMGFYCKRGGFLILERVDQSGS